MRIRVLHIWKCMLLLNILIFSPTYLSTFYYLTFLPFEYTTHKKLDTSYFSFNGVVWIFMTKIFILWLLKCVLEIQFWTEKFWNGKVTWKTEDKQTIFYCLFPLLRFPEFDCIKLKDMQQITDKKSIFRILE